MGTKLCSMVAFELKPVLALFAIAPPVQNRLLLPQISLLFNGMIYVVLFLEYLFSVFHCSTNLVLLVQISSMCNQFSNIFLAAFYSVAIFFLLEGVKLTHILSLASS